MVELFTFTAYFTRSLAASMAGRTMADAVMAIQAASILSYLIFKHYEPQGLLSLTILLGLIPAILTLVIRPLFATISKSIFCAFTSYYSLILLYTVIYRLSPLHPLAKYDGPVLGKVSKWWSSYICAGGKQHLYYKALHERYGDIVRVGPNELSLRDVAAIQSVLGPSGFPKGPSWDNRSQPPSLIAERDPLLHAHRRKPWNRGFTSVALKEYEIIIAKRCRQLLDCFGERIRKSEDGRMTLDLSAWISYFTTDFMGDMAFGGGFELMADGGDIKGIWCLFESGLKGAAVLGHTSWSLKFLSRLPWRQSQNINQMRKFARTNVTKRLQVGASRKDLFYHLNDEEGSQTTRPARAMLASEGILAIIAGSDTTATVLTALFYYLLKEPLIYARLQAEIDSVFPPGEDPVDALKLASMKYLNACINEAMRLQPAVPSGSQRSIARGAGIKIVGGHIIPEETQLFVHTYSMQRDPRYFSPAPDSFLPERWISRSVTDDSPDEIDRRTYVHNTAAFFPFSYGPTICAGKNLALLEMRMVVCWLLQRIKFEPKEGFRLEEWEEGLEDFFVMKKGSLWVSVSSRK
ncbi:hypothetical protein EW146_g4196 [Bondarzewia mesenterica]|uniref:Cytochrome P450 n=1 Tax=Bondarzewia mesenterica TaxID=1095465 RepID=A0A4S4M127_9AGAM|nr:hypothetical protein EW146_g4196 [Bondarzewia mesenterica]